ncbi:WD repeat and coiled-coil-containing protein isoform X2 [Rhinatrema bivittatum]|uniref:WD repeat and coiled-coil-containing protein isoform X2 n=1 Tax=Rhinatrema bivittatum TaxID=194408 RepID=UPI00112A3AA4|nr:WD repeat and coiled-coil-containing protein isoform X2 [Rhinatrema bivittatum]
MLEAEGVLCSLELAREATLLGLSSVKSNTSLLSGGCWPSRCLPKLHTRCLVLEKMELGKGKLLRTGLNALFQAIHPVHGLAWTDGRQVVLTALHIHNEEPKFGESTVIGQFEHVHGLYWGPACSADTPSLLCVQHKKHVTVWQLLYNIFEKIKLMVSRTCEVGEAFPVLPQGCVWHPKQDVLAVLTKRNVSVLYNVRCDNSSVKADIKCSGLIHCACWTRDGHRLVVAVGNALLSYTWDKAERTLNACSICPVFDVGGYICAIETTEDCQVAVATELPLDKICGLNASIAFDVPAEIESSSFSAQTNLLLRDEKFSMAAGKKSADSEKCRSMDLETPSSGPVDLTHILANSGKSDLNMIFQLQRKDILTGSGQDSSHLILVNFEKKVTTTKKVSIPGILAPDILAFDHRAHIIAVASNTCSTILVYSLTSSSMPIIQQINLELNERPKGLCFLTDKMLVVLVGKKKSCDPAFLPSSSSDKYIVRLMVKKVICEDASALPSECQSALSGLDSSVSKGRRRIHFEDCSSDDQFMDQQLLIPSYTVLSSPGRKGLIEEVKITDCEQILTSNASDLDEKSPALNLETLDVELKIRTVSLDKIEKPEKASTRPCETLNVCNNNNVLATKETSQVSADLEKLCSRFADLEKHLSELTEGHGKEKKPSSAYPSCMDPPCVYITYQKNQRPTYTGIENKRCFLLCHGKLRLSTVQELFKISLVEMQHGSLWIVLTADSEGFVPLTFQDKQEIMIRDPSARLDG